MPCNNCEPARLRSRTPDDPGGFQSEVQRALGKQFGQSLEATEKLSDGRLRWLRCVSVGRSHGVPLYWIHNLLSDMRVDGTRLPSPWTVMCSKSSPGNDEQILSSFRFLPRSVIKSEPSVLQDSKASEQAFESVGAKPQSSRNASDCSRPA